MPQDDLQTDIGYRPLLASPVVFAKTHQQTSPKFPPKVLIGPSGVEIARRDERHRRHPSCPLGHDDDDSNSSADTSNSGLPPSIHSGCSSLLLLMSLIRSSAQR